MTVQDWRGTSLIRSPRREVSETIPRQPTVAELRLDRRAKIARAPKNAAIASRMRAHAAAGMTQAQAADAEGVSRSWVCELARFHGIEFVQGKHGPKIGSTYRKDTK